MVKKYLIWLLATLLAHHSWSQLGGQKSFEFLNVPASARLAGLGGINVSLADKDITFLFSNPALTGDSLANYASAGYQFYVSDIGHAAFVYSHKFRKLGTVSFGVQHVNYGEITGYDGSGFELGTFKSGETALVITKSHQVSHFRMGASLKAAFSNIAGFRSSAMLLDIGGTFIHPTSDLTIGLAFKNLGFILSEYSETSDTEVPFDVQVGATFKPEHMPLRFSLTAYNLASGGSSYDNPDDENDDPSSFEKLIRHINVGAEVLLHRHVNVLLAYNFLRQHEFKTDNTGGSGFCIGAAIKIKPLEIVFSRSSYARQGVYSFTVAMNVQKLILKKRAI